MLEHPIHYRGESGEERSQCHVTIDTLPNDVLLEIFSLYQELNPSDLSWWQTFVHVCRRWRHTILGSPLRLRLVLVCNHRTPVRKSLNIWPPFPIAVHHHNPRNTDGDRNIVAALEHRDRVSEISLIRSELPPRLAPLALIQKPFLALTYLRLVPNGNTVLSEAFLGGCTPSLRTVIFEGLSFPALPKLLLSATHLITLQLWRIPITGYISPGAMAACLVFLPNLKHLCIEFQSPRSSPHQIDPPLLTRAVHPALTSFHFNGLAGIWKTWLLESISPYSIPSQQRSVTLSFAFHNCTDSSVT
ncbi:hypothetical protein BJV74DRAFT_881177 [Russula compacta]|nr:hypothetical protein BJV74DRAFT_881177 [Russula compacta]